ncbi:MAG: rpoE 2 [Candidatus Doudnabacteria bacterium]|nr:rpoE 2 [Candidatus Doudnabacteria bacterium]
MLSFHYPQSDEELAIQTVSNPDAYRILVDRHQEPLLNFIYHNYLRDYDQAADIVQEAFIRAYLKSDTFDQTKKWKTWLYTIAINCVKTFLMKPVAEPLDNFSIAGDILPDAQLEKTLISHKLFESLSLINKTHSIILELYYFQNLTYKEISAIIKIPVYSVKTRINYAEKMLRRFYIGD